MCAGAAHDYRASADGTAAAHRTVVRTATAVIHISAGSMHNN